MAILPKAIRDRFCALAAADPNDLKMLAKGLAKEATSEQLTEILTNGLLYRGQDEGAWLHRNFLESGYYLLEGLWGKALNHGLVFGIFVNPGAWEILGFDLESPIFFFADGFLVDAFASAPLDKQFTVIELMFGSHAPENAERGISDSNAVSIVHYMLRKLHLKDKSPAARLRNVLVEVSGGDAEVEYEDFVVCVSVLRNLAGV